MREFIEKKQRKKQNENERVPCVFVLFQLIQTKESECVINWNKQRTHAPFPSFL